MNDQQELLMAKLSATIDSLWGITDSQTVLSIGEKYISYKEQLSSSLMEYINGEIHISMTESFFQALGQNFIFYSYCYGLFRLVPLVAISHGYSIAVLISEKQKARNYEFYQYVLNDNPQINRYNKQLVFICNTDSNIIYRIKSLIHDGFKIIIFFDGNKGIKKEIGDNLYSTAFKKSNVSFHKGLAFLCYLYRLNILNGITISEEDGSFKMQHFVSKLDSNLSKKAYIDSVMQILVNNLDAVIQINTAYQWDSILSLYKWNILFNSNIKEKYTSFKFDKNYYILNHQNFIVTQVDEDCYLQHRLQLL